MQWEIVIGLETHVQLLTQSKIFSGSSTAFGAAPNTQASAVDLALPGTLPVMNRRAVEHAIRFGLAVDAHITPLSQFARKHYFYPDLPKNYQISQFDLPVLQGGKLSFFVGDQPLSVQLTRAHLEEDAGKSLHEGLIGKVSGIDLNRTGTPLLEIVSEPDMRSADEAVAYAKNLHALVLWLGVCDGNMQEGSFRIDANISVRPLGSTVLGTRCEIKNLNSFRFLEKAIQYEVKRQIAVIEDGGKVIQQTRLYDAERDETRAMRSKEDAHDYRYFPDPDLPPLSISSSWIEQIRATMPELPAELRTRWTEHHQLSAYEAALLSSSKEMAHYFETLLQALGIACSHTPKIDNATAVLTSQAKLAANWIIGEVSSQLNRDNLSIEKSPVCAAQLAQLLKRIVDNTLSNKTAKEVFQVMWSDANQRFAQAEPTELVDQLIEAKGLKQISDMGALEKIVDQVLASNPQLVSDVHAGKAKALNALMGQAMKASQGKANPQQINLLLNKKLGVD